MTFDKACGFSMPHFSRLLIDINNNTHPICCIKKKNQMNKVGIQAEKNVIIFVVIVVKNI